MNIAINIDNFNNDYVFLKEPIKNTVIDNSLFIRTIYSNEHLILSGIYIFIQLNIINVEKYFNKYKCCFNVSENNDIIDKIINIEKQILNNFHDTSNSKNRCTKIIEQFKSGHFKVYSDNPNFLYNGKFIIKISGLWVTTNDYGITYKLINIID